jgi:methylthioribulose-1-phosphate dehydratase
VAENFQESAIQLAEISRTLYGRGWVLGTSGNFSAVVNRDPLRLAISPSGVDKGLMSTDQILLVDEHASVVSEHSAKPSDECPLHSRVVLEREAGAVLHTHSVWGTILSDLHVQDGGVAIEGFEMLKGLQGVTTHEHREWIPILGNDQDMTQLAAGVRETLAQHPAVHGFLIHRHGLYTWGETLADAERHVEILEFLFETVARHNQASTARS